MEMTFNLHKKQGEILLSKATEILYGGAVGGGKSHAMRVISILLCVQIPHLQVYLFRRNFPDLLKNHMDGPSGYPVMLQNLIKSKQCSINWGKMEISFKNGAKIHLCHLQNEKAVYKYQGAEIHLLLMDELTHFLKKEYTYLRARCRLGGLEIPEEYKTRLPLIVCGSNPGGIGHNWVKQMFVDYATPMKIKRASKRDGGMLRQYIPAVMKDNPTLMENDPDYVDKVAGLGNPALVKAYKTGDWNIVAGGAFDDIWNQDIHVIKPFRIPRSWYIDRSLDWGSAKPSSVGYWAESDGSTVELSDGTLYTFPAGTLFRIHEYYSWTGEPNEGLKLSSEELAKKIRSIDRMFSILKYEVNPGPADNQIFNASHIKKDHKSISIASVMEKEGVSWTGSNKAPGTRKQGFEILRTMLKESTKEHPEKACLYIFENCRHFIRTIPVLPRDEKDPDDVDSNAEDHVYDESRYRVLQKRDEILIQETDHI